VTSLGSVRALGRHLLDVDSLGADGIDLVLAEAERLRAPVETSHMTSLRGRTVVNFFYEASTRTRLSFELAAKRLGAHVLNVSSGESSVTKGESLVDTARTLEALGADAVVLRHPEPGAPYLMARSFGGSVLNAGDGRHGHPTQALLDLLTMRQSFGDVRGLRVAIVGDIEHSRVARSTAVGLLLCGADVRLCGPRTLLPPDGWIGALPRSDRGGRITQTTSLAEALADAHVVMALRMQSERQAGGLLPSLKEFVTEYGLTAEKLARLAPDALVMHPGPANEGVEIAPDLMASPNSLISRQVSNGVLVRMAVLKLLLGADDE
jgi:aspartate carbamoyltransferase catalytic subunit